MGVIDEYGNPLASWTCEIGGVPYYRVPDEADGPLRKAVQEAFSNMFPSIEPAMTSGWGVRTDDSPSNPFEPNLGCATTRELIEELGSRLEVTITIDNVFTPKITTVLALRDIRTIRNLLTEEELDYRTIDH